MPGLALRSRARVYLCSNVSGNVFPTIDEHMERTASCPPKKSSGGLNPGIPPLFKLYPVGQGSSNVPGNVFPIRAPHVEQTASCPPKKSSGARLINPGIPPLFKLYPVGQGSSNVPGNVFPIRDPHIHILSFCWPRARGLAEHPWMVVCDPYGKLLSI